MPRWPPGYQGKPRSQAKPRSSEAIVAAARERTEATAARNRERADVLLARMFRLARSQQNTVRFRVAVWVYAGHGYQGWPGLSAVLDVATKAEAQQFEAALRRFYDVSMPEVLPQRRGRRPRRKIHVEPREPE